MTDHHHTIYQHQASPDRKTPGSSFGLAPELLTKARARVKWFAFAMMIMSLIGACFTVSWNMMGAVTLEGFFRQLTIFGVNSTISAIIWLIARGSRFSDSLVLHFGLLLEVLICLGAAIGTNMDAYQVHGGMAGMSWVTPIIILFPLIVPYPPKRMLIASLITACTEPISVFIIWFTTPIERNPWHFEVLIFPVLAAGLAYFASRIIWGLNVEVTRARRLGSYQLETCLGRGGMGEVWRASHQMLARPAAVKLIHSEALTSDIARAQATLSRFEHEAQATASLRSPHTIQLYDFGRAEDGAFYYVMELLDGIDLLTLIDKYGPQDPARVIHILVQVCHSLEEAHQSGLIHRDIKPANLFVCRYGTDDDFVKVLDFGLVKEVRSGDKVAQQLTQHDMMLGTPGFMPPELALSEKYIDGRADLYAVGCVAFWLLTGAMLFSDDTPMKTLMRHVSETPDPPSVYTELPVPSELDSLVLQCLEKDPSNRPHAAREVSTRLQAIQLDQPWTSNEARQWWDTHRPV